MPTVGGDRVQAGERCACVHTDRGWERVRGVAPEVRGLQRPALPMAACRWGVGVGPGVAPRGFEGCCALAGGAGVGQAALSNV